MKLTQLQKNCIQKLAAADVRAEDTMLGLLLAEGIRFFYCDNESINRVAPGKSTQASANEMADLIIEEVNNNLN